MCLEFLSNIVNKLSEIVHIKNWRLSIILTTEKLYTAQNSSKSGICLIGVRPMFSFYTKDILTFSWVIEREHRPETHQ